jgi:hypothetical protein
MGIETSFVCDASERGGRGAGVDPVERTEELDAGDRRSLPGLDVLAGHGAVRQHLVVDREGPLQLCGRGASAHADGHEHRG